ncbi:prefoldin subunit beta [Candidatus Nitrosarchaeum limnium]|jgi:prefoldin beta subunit|uniref:Prefoldin subunit beta n=1 Tax=Candidatus Nitrosarchaeum limnium BG20 TaxID=859192 RepID=S2E3R7_9ARCH|nr:prefoldin subunit beta [Candidatus Nitrosarchaeum limnium]EPA05428.1 prefoldin, beta subunit [Candidatus Nitrosarchaeum limnium BG20]
MSSDQMPPWLQEQLMKMQQSQQNLQSIMTQKQHLEMERLETDKALEELKKAADDDTVYKHAGSILIKSTKSELIADLEERKEMAKTRLTVLEKQESRIKESLKEQEAKITEMMRSPPPGGAQMSRPTPSSGSQIPKPSTDDNPRK